MTTSDQIIRERRTRLGLTQPYVAAHLGVSDRTIARWESEPGYFGQTAKVSQAIALCKLFGMRLDEITGLAPPGMDLSGSWHARHDTRRNGVKVVDRHEISARYDQSRMILDADGDYLWRGELLVRGYTLTGTYQATDVGVNNEGTLYFWMHPSLKVMVGHWMGRSYEYWFGTGWSVLARDPDDADEMIEILLAGGYRNLTEWPTKE